MDYLQLAQGVGIMFVIVLFAMAILYLLWKWLKMAKNPILYGLFGKKMKEADIEWCAIAISNGWTMNKCKAKLLLEGHSKKRINELMYIYKKVKKEMKGGEKNA